MADFLLSIGVDTGVSYEEMRKGIQEIVGRLNREPPKIKILFDDSNIEKRIASLHNQIEGINKQGISVVASQQFQEALNNINNNLDTLSKKITDLGNNTNFNNLTDSLKTMSVVIESLQTELSALQKSMSTFGGFNINLGLSGGNQIAKTAQYGKTARQTVAELKSQATALEEVFKQYTKMADGFPALMKAIQGTNVLQGKDIFSILNNTHDTKLSLTKQMDAWREYIALMQEAARVKNIDISGVTSSFSRSANELIESTQKILTGESELETGTEKLKSIFGSGVNADKLDTQLTNINDNIIKVTESINGLKLNETTFESFIASVNKVSEAISNLMSSIDKLSNIKVELDTSVLNNTLAQISTINNSIQQSTNSVVNKSADESKISYQDATRAVKEYYSVLLQLSKTKNDIALTENGWKSQTGQWDELASALNRTKSAYDLCTNSENRSKLSIQEQISLLQLITTESNKYALSIEKQANKAQDVMAAAEAKRQDAEAAKTQTEIYKEAEQAIAKYYQLLTKLATTKNDVSLNADGRYASKDGGWNELANALNRAYDSYQKLNEITKDLSLEQRAELLKRLINIQEQYNITIEKTASASAAAAAKKQDAEALAAQAQAYKQAESIISRYYQLLTKTVTNKTDITQNEKGRFVSQSGDWNELATSLTKAAISYQSVNDIIRSLPLEQQTQLIRKLALEQQNYNIALEKSSVAASNAQAKRDDAETVAAQTKVYKEAESAITQYYQVMKQYATTITDITNIDGKYVSQSGNWNELAAALNRVTDNYSKVGTAMKSLPADKQAELTNKLTTAQESYNVALEKHRASLAAAEAKRQDAVRIEQNYESTLGRVQQALRNYSAAETSRNSKSREAYQTLKNQMTALVDTYHAVKSGTKSYSDLDSVVKQTNITFRESANIIKENGDATQKFTDRVGGLAKKFSTWFGITRIIMAAVRTIRKMVSASIELEDALAGLQIVTRDSDATMSKFGSTAATVSKKIGSSITDFVSSATTYARLGYSLDESSKLAEYTAMLQNVGDIDVGNAQNAITAIVKAFDDIDIDNIESVMDKLVTTGNNFPISVSEIAEGMNNASSSLAAAGNTFEQSVALLTAANTTIQDAAKSSTGLRTIAARIRNTKTELDELGETMTEANYEEVVKQLTDFNVALTDANGEYRSTYDIMSDIAAKWSDMTSMEQAALADALSGTRQQAVFYSIIEQFQEASGAMDAMSNSAGALENAYSMYMETATAHINQFKASFQELASNLISGGLITTIVDIGTAIVNMVNALQKVHLLLPAIVTTVAIIKGLKMAKVIAESNSKIATLTSGIIAEKGATDALSVSVSQLTIKEKQRLATNIQNAVVQEKLTAEEAAQILSTLGLATAEGTLTVANKGLAASFKSVMASIPVWGWIALGISVLVEAIGWMTSSFDNSTESIKILDEEFKQLKDTIDSTANNFRSLKESADSTIPRFVELAQGVNEFGENVSLTDEEYAEFLKLNNKIAEMFPELNLGMDSSGNAMLALSYSADTLTDSLNNLVEAQRRAAYETIAETMPDVLENISSFENEYKSQIQKAKDLKNEWESVYSEIVNNKYTTETEWYKDIYEQKAKDELAEIERKAKALGLSVKNDKRAVRDNGGSGARGLSVRYEIEWDYESVDNADVKALYDAKLAEQDKLINDLQNKIAAKWKSINPIINSWLQTDFIFNDLNSRMQAVAEMIVSGLDFSKLGLTTKEEVTDYITQNILDPLFLAGDDVKEAFASIVDWQDQLKKGQISSEEFSQRVKGAFDSLISSMDEDKVEQFKSIFISSMNAMGISGDDFDAVIEQLIASWGRFSDSSTSNNFSKFIKDATENLENLTKKLQTLQSQSSSIQSELNSLSNSMNSLNNGEILSYESLLQLIEKYPLYATELANAADNAELQKQALEHLFEAKKNDYILTQKSAIDTIKASNEQTKVIIRNSELEMKARAKSVGGQWDRDIEEFIERRFANEKKQIAENEKLIEEYEAKIKFAQGLSIDDLVTTSNKSSTKTQTWFDKQYNYHKHMVNMEKETEKDYFNWLDNAYKKAYSEGIIDLDNYYKYEEEVYNGRKKLNGDTTSWFEKEYKLHQHLRNMEAESDKKYYDWLESAYKKAYKEGLIDLDAYRKYEEEVYNGRKKLNGDTTSWFEKEYKLHQHLLNMDSEGQKDYLNWLSSAYKKAYKEGLITLDDYRKYQEEVYKGLQSLFKDYLSDIEHEIDMRSSIEGNNKKIISLYKELIKKIEKEIKATKASGLDDTDDYIQELQKKWLSYSDEIKKIQDDTKDNAKSAVEKLVDIRLKMLKQDIDSEKDALNKKLNNLKDFYQKQKEMLQDAYDEEKYLEERSEKRKSVSDIKAQLKQLEYDDSAWAQKRKLELSDELIEAQKDLKDFEREHSIDVTQDRLDKLYEAQEDKINKKIETLESKESDAQSLYKKALSDIKNGSIQLYEEMIDWNNVYGDGIKDTIADAWEEAYKALLDYKNLFGSFYKNIKLYNATGYIVPQDTWDNSPVSNNGAKSASASSAKTSTSSSQSSGNTTTKTNTPTNTTTTSNTSSSKTSTNTSQQSTAKLDDNTKRKVAAAIWRGTYGWGAGDDRTKKLNEVFGANNGIQTLVNQGVGLNDSAPSNDYTYLNMRKKFKGYASGTSKAIAGLHTIDELGTETIFESSDGTKYKMFTGGEKVLNAKASDFLYKFATGGTAILEKIIQYASGGNLNSISPPVVQNQISMGNIIVEGNADRATVSEIRRAQRDSIDTMLKALNRLSK